MFVMQLFLFCFGRLDRNAFFNESDSVADTVSNENSRKTTYVRESQINQNNITRQYTSVVKSRPCVDPLVMLNGIKTYVKHI